MVTLSGGQLTRVPTPSLHSPLALTDNTVQISTDGLPPLRNTEQQRSEYSRGEGGEDAVGWALVVARPGPSSINLSLI